MVALAISIIAIFAAVNFNKVCTLYMCYLISTDQVRGLHIYFGPRITEEALVTVSHIYRHDGSLHIHHLLYKYKNHLANQGDSPSIKNEV